MQDVAYFFVTRVSTARGWMAALQDELIEVECGGRAGLRALAGDRRDLATPKPKASQWPTRLLRQWDTLLMGHADKTWTVPESSEETTIWREAAFVAPVVVARGQFVVTWSHKVRGKRVDLTIEPLSGWRASHLAGARKEARALAEHLGVERAEITVV